MGEMIYNFLNSSRIVLPLAVVCIISFVFFVVYALSILGSACIYSAIILFVAMNIFTQFTYTVTSNVVIFTNSIRLVFAAFFLSADIAVLVLRKLR